MRIKFLKLYIFKEGPIMTITIIGRQMNVWDQMKSAIEHKLERFEKYFGDDCTATATLSTKRNMKCLEITIVASGVIFRSEVEDETFRNALDKAIYSIERQIRKNKTRLERRLRDGAFADVYDTGEDYEDEPEFRIRRKAFPIKPMSVEEAIMQMNLLDHEFFVFKDEINDAINVVYKRHDGDYGLICEEED
jgi:putative sigma-54 modulation protein